MTDASATRMLPTDRIDYSAIIDRPALKLPGGAWTDALTGRAADSVVVADMLDTYPVALLVRG